MYDNSISFLSDAHTCISDKKIIKKKKQAKWDQSCKHFYLIFHTLKFCLFCLFYFFQLVIYLVNS